MGVTTKYPKKDTLVQSVNNYVPATNGQTRITGKLLNFLLGSLANLSNAEASRSYKAHLNQGGSDAPTSKEYENELGDITLFRESQGNYYLLSADGSFTADKTVLPNDLFLSADGAASGLVALEYVDENRINIRTYDSGGSLQDGFLLGSAENGRDYLLEIKVYE